MLREEVDEEDIAATVAKWTGIPVTRLLDGATSRRWRYTQGLAATRGGSPPPVRGVPVRRDQEGHRGRLQRAPAAARRRAPGRRPRAHGGLPEPRRHHDVEPREPHLPRV